MENVLEKESELYKKLNEAYSLEKSSKENFYRCINIAKQAETREVRFVLFKLKCLYEDTDTGMNIVNMIERIAKFFIGDSIKSSFMIAVLEASLDE